jgi:hypothetical protein
MHEYAPTSNSHVRHKLHMWYLEHVVLQHVRRYWHVDLAYGSYEGAGKVM